MPSTALNDSNVPYFSSACPAAIAVLKDKEPGAFLIRDSNSFQGAYGLALKVTTPPLNANLNASKGLL